MQSHNTLKKEFLKKWIMGLQICSSSKENMTLLERKKAIKLSSDLAIASTRNNVGKKRSSSSSSTTTWSHALITKASSDRETGTLAKQILSNHHLNTRTPPPPPPPSHHRTTRMSVPRRRCHHKKNVSRKTNKFIIISSNNNNNNNNKVMRARSMAKRLVKKRTQILKGLIPGGEYMDEYSLMRETLDYIVSLRAQVDVMNHLAYSNQIFIHN